MTRSRATRWLAWLGLPLLALGLLIAFWSWDWFIPLVEHRASAALGRPVTMAHLHVGLGRITTIAADDIRIGNPEGFPEDPPFARVPHAAVELDLKALLSDRSLVLPSITLERPMVEVLGREDGSRNYAFDLGTPAGETGEPAAASPRIGALRILEGQAHVAIAWLRSDFALAIATRDAPGQEPAIAVEARGTYAAQPITGQMLGGAILTLRDESKPWPVEVQLQNGPTRLALHGTVQDPLHFRGTDLRLQLAGPDMSLLEPLIGFAIPPTTPYELAGQLDYAEGRIRFREATGRVGHSDLAGTITVTTSGARPDVTADLHSRRVDLADLGGFIGSQPGRASTPGQTPQQRRAVARAEASPRLLPTTPVSLPRLLGADVRLRYKAERIEGRDMPFDSLETEMAIREGVITLRPVSFGIGQGRLGGSFVLAPREDGALRAQGEIELRRVDLSRLLGAAGVGGSGTLGGVGRIEGTGRSFAEILGHGDGALTVVTVGGNISALVVDLSGLQFGNALLSALGIPARTRIECLIGDFALRRGTLTSRTLFLDTEDSVVTGEGSIDLARERLDLWLRTEAKHFTVGSLPAPIHITGTLKNPGIGLDAAELAARGGAAVGLGVLLPPLALLPTIQLGVGENSQCEALASGSQRRRAPAEGGGARR